MPVTEVGCHPLKAGITDVMDETTHEGKILTTAWKAVTNEETGPYCVYWGQEVENPSNCWGFFDFESVKEHQTFAKEYVPIQSWAFKRQSTGYARELPHNKLVEAASSLTRSL